MTNPTTQPTALYVAPWPAPNPAHRLPELKEIVDMYDYFMERYFAFCEVQKFDTAHTNWDAAEEYWQRIIQHPDSEFAPV